MAEKDDIGLKLALKATGTAEKLASDLKITPQAISQWERIPLNRVFEVERITGVSRHHLRPDFFGKEANKAGAA